ncbi:restriction endonuclease subunit S [Haemophilus influenzae]|uniref:restriction endonuclease subunit S n=1 Tax=Haemophilus influenzae TaxID=727 RepID=UPI003AAFE84B
MLKLADIVKIKGGKRLPKGENLQITPNTHPYIRVRDMKGKFIPTDELEYVPDHIFPKIKNYIVNTNDVIVSIVGTIGLVSIITEKLNNASQTENCAKLSGLDRIDAEYLYYFLISEIGQAELQKATVGAVQPKLPLYGLENVSIDWKTRTEREEIVKQLNSLDNKIQLNTQINQTLEKIAQALFKSWFIDFDPVRAKAQALSDGLSLEQAELAAIQAISGKTPEELTALSQTQPDRYTELAETAKAFPCEMVEVDGVEVPKGWEYKPADELFDIGIGKTPLRKETEWFSTNPDDMQWISIKDMGNSGVFITESSEFLTNQAVDKFNIRKIPENTVLLSFKLTIGRVSITTCETTTNEAIAHFKITDKSFLTTEYLYLFFQQFDFNSLGSTSSIATAVNSKTIKGIEILIPNEELIKAFQMKISNIFAQIKNLTIENKNLVETRDLLLPRLLNGELNG